MGRQKDGKNKQIQQRTIKLKIKNAKNNSRMRIVKSKIISTLHNKTRKMMLKKR